MNESRRIKGGGARSVFGRTLGFAVVALQSVSLCAADCRPEAWFHLIGGNASKAGVVADLDAIRAAGIGGIQLFHGGWAKETPWPGVTESIPCLSEKWDDLIGFVADECAKRGLSFKMQNCPGWSMSGGPWIPKELAMRKLVSFEPGREPKWTEDDDYHEIARVTFPVEPGVMVTFPNPQQLNHHWAYEPEADLVVLDGDRVVFSRRCPQGAWHDVAGQSYVAKGIDPASFGRLRGEVRSRRYGTNAVKVVFSAERKLDNWEAKAGWGLRDIVLSADSTPVASAETKTLVFGHVNAKIRNHPAPAHATGWECDKMDPRGFTANFNGYLGRLIKGPLAGGKLKGTLVDSWECGVQTWTWKMEAEFRRLNGYELRPWLPAIFGYVLKSEAETEKFLLDWRRTCSRLVEDNYYGTMAKLAHENGMSIQFETAFGDVLPGDLMRFWKYADEPMCEFWSPFDNDRGFVYSHDFKPVRPCVSAAHVYGKRRVSAEAFTSFKLTWDESMQERKEDANRHFARGLTHLVFQTYTHNPVVGGRPPSSSFGAPIGTPFLRRQTWWPFMPGFTKYLETCCRELERGLPVVDILWYLGDAIGHKPSERGDRFGNGYKYDYLNSDALMTRVAVKDGRFAFPDGMSYRVLWVPADSFLLPETERKLAELEKAGGRIVRGDFKPDWAPDVAVDSKDDVLWYHRRDGEDDVYFVAAEGKGGFDGTVRLRDVPGEFRLRLARGESRFIRRGYVEPERIEGNPVELKDWSLPLGAWKDLPGSAEEKAFSGTKAYVTKVNLADKPGEAVLDLGRVCYWAKVSVNGREVANLWCEPYRCDVTRFLKSGENEIKVEVTSTWHNRLVYDASLPETERKTWTIAGPDKGAPLRDSGLFGPVRIFSSDVRKAVDRGFTLGADVSWITEMEKKGEDLRTAAGETCDVFRVMGDYGLSAVRLRVWVSPTAHGNWCDKNDLLAKALQAKKAGMDVMVDFHYSDWWADPGQQNIPAAWRNLSKEQIIRAVADHTRDVLGLLRANGVTPRWVQVGNETNNGLFWTPKKGPDGKTQYVKQPSGLWRPAFEWSFADVFDHADNYAAVFRSGYDAVKSVFPQSVVIVHLANGFDKEGMDWHLGELHKYGAKWDMVGVSLYPYHTRYRNKVEEKTIDETIEALRYVEKKWNCDTMVVETGFECVPEKYAEGRRRLADVIRRTRELPRCRGVFYWEPQCRPKAYPLGAFDAEGRPTPIMDGFLDR